jgi:hypothetical protein
VALYLKSGEGNTATYTLLDTETVSVVSEGLNSTTPGPAGRSVLSTIKYYKLCNQTLADGNQPDNSTANPTEPTNKTKSDRNKGWQVSPPTFETGYDYFETTRTQYNTADTNGHYYSWSVPVKNAMLTVEFLDALGITAKKL